MKEVVIHNIPEDKVYLLTDEEFSEALTIWAKGVGYLCGRLEALIPPKHKWAETPREDFGYEVFILTTPRGGVQKFFKKDGKFFQEVFDGNKNRKVEIVMEKSILPKLINQEYFYKPKKLLK